jgi:hypothetical protein
VDLEDSLMKTTYRVLAAAAGLAAVTAFGAAAYAAQSHTAAPSVAAVAGSACRLDAVAAAPAGADPRWLAVWQHNPASQAPGAQTPALAATDAVAAAKSMNQTGATTSSLAAAPAAAVRMSYARAAASTGDNGAEGIVAPDRCVWVVTVDASFTPRSHPYGVAARHYDSYTAVFDAATGQYLSVTAGATAPDVLTGANIAAN